MRRVAEQRVELTLWLAERFDPELLIVVFMAADHAHHLGWDEWERSGAESPLAKVYGILDDAVGALAGALGGDIMIVSDHGGGPLHGVVNLNAWLAEQGLLRVRGRRRADARRAARSAWPPRARWRPGAACRSTSARASSSASAACASAATSCRTTASSTSSARRRSPTARSATS